jgi:hypothetical protein
MIVRANLQAVANAKIAEWTGNPADAETFTVPLYDAGGVVRAYWCDWNMGATRNDVQAFVAHLLATTNLDANDLTIRNGLVAIGSRKALIFDADVISPEAALAHLNLFLSPSSTDETIV